MDSFRLTRPSDTNKICKLCNKICYAIRFQHNFRNWTSGNDDVDKLVQTAQLSVHDDAKEALEWIPYDRLYNIKYIAENRYRANWIDGYINKKSYLESYWDDKNQSWKREGTSNMFVNLKSLNDLTLEFINEIKVKHIFYGITQDPGSNNYMMVLNNKCKKCNEICNAIYFQQKFIDWTSGNDYIDKFIQDTQLLAHYDIKEALEWIPYDRLYNIKYIAEDRYRAIWSDGNISYGNCYDYEDNFVNYENLVDYGSDLKKDYENLKRGFGGINYWDNNNQNWKRKDTSNLFVNLKILNTPNNLTIEFTNEIRKINKFYGITQNPETKIYMIVIDDICKKCNYICDAIYFQRNFYNWTSGIDVLEWIPYDRLNTSCWDDENQNWKREGTSNMFVKLKCLNTPKDLTIEFTNKIRKSRKFYGITQDPETKSYFLVLDDICEKCNYACISIHFQQNFKNWDSDNHDINNFIQNAQLSIHSDYEVSKVIEWIPYDRLYDIKYVAEGGFGKIYRAHWSDGYIRCWDSKKQNWRRRDQHKFVALKNLNNSKNVTLDFMNEITLHYKVNDLLNSFIKFYGITQDPITKNYIMVMNFAENGSLRKFLDFNYSKLNWFDRINCLWIIAYGLNLLHRNELIHRDFHIGNILYESCKRIYITDMGLCKPADYNALENAKSTIYGNLPYIAPEILRGQSYTEAADVYSFGIIMYEVISGLPPYCDIGHDETLAIKICKGLRPRFNIKVPILVVHLIKRCLDADSSNRPTANEIYKILREWYDKLSDKQTTELQKQIEEADEINKNSSNSSIHLTSLSYKTHSGASYTSRLLNYNNLPEPINSDDYYEQNDNIISMKFSESLQIDISQLKISDNIINKENFEYSESSLQINVIEYD
ncbi:kinase-like domain-containing protein [Rhizophagus clarus]|uniref:Kinase-like domain-containing protein n=1 Tax=Rhizophagus clarus TaxID=94130 RepID=A0A8H3MH15_9GLOM|nr:kinase-like domain-containing protein [Rhizophagus clarus]